MTKESVPVPIDLRLGVMPPTDNTPSSHNHYQFSQGIRADQGTPKKIGGWANVPFDYGAEIQGTVRNVSTAYINGKLYTVLGTNEKLYSLIGSRLTNITPLDTTSIPIPDSLATQYGTLANNPFTSVSGSPILTVADSEAGRFQAGDTVVLSGATGFAGILAGSINGDAIVRSVGTGFYTINVGTNANASTTGGGGSVVRTSGLINVTDAAHGQSDGDRVKITDAADTGGILAAEINAEHIIRNVDTNDFDIMTIGTATSSVTAGGGSATEYYQEIPVGNLNESATQGYGAGLYGVGLYGTALVSSASRSLPRIWFVDRYADTFVMTPGNQGKVYQWMGDNAVAPEVVQNAPTAVNYLFVSDNILVTLGAGGTENRVYASDQNDITSWSSSSTNQVFDDDIEGAGRLLSHCPVDDYNLLYTDTQTYSFRYIGLPFVWEIELVDPAIGIIAPMARVQANGIPMWQGLENFHMYRGGRVEIIPSNNPECGQCTALRYVYGDLNFGQKSKFFAWYNTLFNEVWFHYGSENSNECDRVIRPHLYDMSWWIDEMPRTAGEWPSVRAKNPTLANVSTVYRHEIGSNDDGAPLEFILTSARRNISGKDNAFATNIWPDSVQDGNITVNMTAYRYPQSQNYSFSKDYTVSQSTEFLTTTGVGRFIEITWSGAELDQDWNMGQWYQEIQKGPTQ